MAVEPVHFVVGPISRAAAAVLAGGTGGYAILTGLYAARAFRARLEDRWSAAVATLVMGALAGLLYERGADLVPAPFSIVLIAVLALAIAITLTYTLGRYKERTERFRVLFGKRLTQLLDEFVPEERQAEWQRLRSAFQLDPEGRRKTPHLLLGLFIPLYAGAGFLILRGLSKFLRAAPTHDELLGNLYAAAHAVDGPWLAAGQVAGSFGLLALLYLLVPNELLRLRFPELSYPFKAVILSRLRKREKGLFGAHYYIAATMPLAALWLTRDAAHWDVTVPAVAAAIAVSVFADAASALVGIRYGRRKWFHNPNKTYLGSLGGTVVAFAVALLLVGLPMALASAAVFFIVDLWAPVPFSVSDNLLNPLALAACYGAGQGYLAPWVPYY